MLIYNLSLANFCGMAMHTIFPASISETENVGSFAQKTSEISGLEKTQGRC